MVVHIDPTKFNRTCPRCQATVHGADAQTCPRCSGSMIPACVACGYDLAGLPREGQCPECGTSVAMSYAPDLLENRSLLFLTQLRSGLTLVIWGTLAQLLLGLGVFTLAIVMSSGALPRARSFAWHSGMSLLIQVLVFGLSLLVLFGWWRITTPDPARVGTDLDVKPRQVIRIAVVLQATAALASLIAGSIVLSAPTLAAGIADVATALGWVSDLAWIVQFFAAMLYIQWLARRIPDTKLYTDARRFMWLGPVLYTVGALCIGLGPLVALILYLIMLFVLRRHLTTILLRLGAL
ncbi:MAG: hypothetical protein Q9O74_06970 [Planctomycetota bacterium]|nr:hypothetical protein [Planctomycetota bacterium]